MCCKHYHDLIFVPQQIHSFYFQRIPAKEALDAEYFWTDPLPCDPKRLMAVFNIWLSNFLSSTFLPEIS
jgi:hypothetical protein